MHNENTRRRREKRTEEIFEIVMTENFPKLTSNPKLQIKEAQGTPSRINAKTNKQKINKKTASQYIIFKLQKIKDKKKLIHLYTVGGNVNWCSHCGKQYGGFSKN